MYGVAGVAHNFDCTLSFKTKSKISSTMESNGYSFADCQSRCVSEFDTTPKSKIRVKHCDCYCAMYHDPYPEIPSTTGIIIYNTIVHYNIILIV